MVMGTIITVNSKLSLRGSTTVPKSSPTPAISSEASTITPSAAGQWAIEMCGACPGACTKSTHGKTTRPATHPWMAPATILEKASIHSGTGARTRSSISRVYDSSITSGVDTDMIPCIITAEATIPGTRMVENVIPVSYTHLRAHETRHDLVCRLL